MPLFWWRFDNPLTLTWPPTAPKQGSRPEQALIPMPKLVTNNSDPHNHESNHRRSPSFRFTLRLRRKDQWSDSSERWRLGVLSEWSLLWSFDFASFLWTSEWNDRLPRLTPFLVSLLNDLLLHWTSSLRRISQYGLTRVSFILFLAPSEGWEALSVSFLIRPN